MPKSGDLSLIRGIKNKDEKTVALIYRKVFPMIRKFILKNKGSVQDAEDIFQEALLIIYRNVQRDEFNLTCKFSTFVYKICKNLWNKELRRRKFSHVSYYEKEDLLEEISFDTQTEKDLIKMYLKHIKNLSQSCQKILLLHFENRSIDEIMNVMGYKVRQTALDKKFRCKKQLIDAIKSDPEFNKLQNELLSTDRKIF